GAAGQVPGHDLVATGAGAVIELAAGGQGGDLEDRGGGAVDVGARQGDGLGGVLVGADRLGAGHRRVVDRVDGDVDRRRVRVRAAVVGLVGERVGAVVVGGRGVGERAIGVHRGSAMGRPSDLR